MTLALTVDADRWRRHLQAVLDRNPGLVPVIKGNGYGFGVARLAAEAQRLGVDTVAVGEAAEAEKVRERFSGQILVMAPWHPRLGAFEPDPKLLRTVAHVESAQAMAGSNHRMVVELRTAMNRSGLDPAQLEQARGYLRRFPSAGWALHLPLAGDPVAEALRVLEGAAISGPDETVWVSHVLDGKLRALHRRLPAVTLRPRVGTALWLGDRKAFQATATVLDVHRLSRRTPYGYRQRTMKRDGYLLVLSGGTGHGVGLEAPRSVRGLLPRAKLAAIGLLGAGGRTLSPYVVGGRQR
ncbi:alanine racemase, partial [Motilibacter deserti]|nr:alanine racemase [Motilibacter deserti]